MSNDEECMYKNLSTFKSGITPGNCLKDLVGRFPEKYTFPELHFTIIEFIEPDYEFIQNPFTMFKCKTKGELPNGNIINHYSVLQHTESLALRTGLLDWLNFCNSSWKEDIRKSWFK